LVSSFPERHAAWHALDGFDEWYNPPGTGAELASDTAPYAEEWLEENAGMDDWYLHVNFWDPHIPYNTPVEYGNPFEDDPAPEWPPEEVIQQHYEGYGPHSARDLHGGWNAGWDGVDENDLHPRIPPEIATREDFEQWIDGYDVGIHYMDHCIGRLCDLLKEAGVFDETLIIVSADHGENQGELNVYGDHHTADRKTCRIPLIVRGPDIQPGMDDGFHYHLDLPPTLVELAGGAPASRWDGRSFAETLLDGTEMGREYLVLGNAAWACQRSVRWDRWLLMQTYHDGFKDFDPIMLFDLENDPHETENLAEENPSVVEEGLSLLHRWHSRRMMEAATGENGGVPHAMNGVTDPMWEVLREGGPYHIRGYESWSGDLQAYVEWLRETDRAEHAEALASTEGFVTQWERSG